MTIGPATGRDPATPHRAEAAFLVADGAILALYPLAWTAPLLRTGLLPFLSGDEISILSGLRDLWESDRSLAILVGLLGVAIPWLKSLALLALHLGRLGPSALPLLAALAKLSMADVFLLALAVVVAKGVGIGHVETAWGLHLFAALTLGSMLLSHLTSRRLRSASWT